MYINQGKNYHMILITCLYFRINLTGKHHLSKNGCNSTWVCEFILYTYMLTHILKIKKTIFKLKFNNKYFTVNSIKPKFEISLKMHFKSAKTCYKYFRWIERSQCEQHGFKYGIQHGTTWRWLWWSDWKVENIWLFIQWIFIGRSCLPAR